MNEAPVLSIENLRIALGARGDRAHAVDDVSLHIQRNEILCVVGESGSGKSVMAKSILQLLPPQLHQRTSGRIFFEGVDLLAASPQHIRQVRGQRIAMIFQEPMVALNSVHRVGAQVDEILEVHTSLTRAQRRQRVIDLLTDVKLPNPAQIVDRYPHELSGGQRQRVMIAMALALEPALVIADEPTTALDVTTQSQVLRLIRELQRKHGTAVLFITHDFGVVAEIADRVVVMHHGRLVEQGPTQTVLSQPEKPYTQGLIAAVPSLVPRHATAAAASSQEVLTLKDVFKSYPARNGLFGRGKPVQAVQGVSFEVRKGRSVALVGESGSGKSTLAKAIVGLDSIDTGQILLDGEDIAGLGRKEWGRVRRKVQMVFQDPFASLNPRLRVSEIISTGPMLNGASREEAHDQTRELLRLVGLKPEAIDRYPHEFSGGQRQRIGVARALAMKPSLIVADEPVSALDVSVQRQVLDLLEDLRTSLSLSMLFITHDLRVAADVCEDILVMSQGRIVERGQTGEVFARPAHPYTKSLFESVPGRQWHPSTSASPKVAVFPTASAASGAREAAEVEHSLRPSSPHAMNFPSPHFHS